MATDKIQGGEVVAPKDIEGEVASETWNHAIPASAIPGSGNHGPDRIEKKPRPKAIVTNVAPGRTRVE